MIWVDAAKRFLAALVSHDEEIIISMLSDSAEWYHWHNHAVGKHKIIETNKRFMEIANKVSIRIDNTAYRDKFVCLECELSYNPAINVDKYITPDVDKKIEEYALSQKSNDQLLNFEFESFKVGKMALYELSLKNKLIKEELNTNEERAEIVDKIKQIIKFNHALKKIYSDLNPEVFVTTNGYYYITNFFLQFGKQRGAKTISISNSSSYRFSRNDLKIFHQHELLDMEIQKSLFHLYKDVYLHKKTLMHALTNAKSQIKKEHSHSF